MSTTTSPSTLIPTGTWTVDPAHSKVGFAVKHMGIATVRGEFTDFQGALEIGEDPTTLKVYGTVKAESVDTNEPQRDDHLRSPDFFDAAKFPELRFESTSIEALDDEEFRITGNLTMHGKTNKAVFDVQGKRVGDTTTGTATSTIYMTDSGMQPPNLANIAISQNQVLLTIEYTAKEG